MPKTKTEIKNTVFLKRMLRFYCIYVGIKLRKGMLSLSHDRHKMAEDDLKRVQDSFKSVQDSRIWFQDVFR